MSSPVGYKKETKFFLCVSTTTWRYMGEWR